MESGVESRRVSVFVDGFNVYHGMLLKPLFSKYKWLDYWKLAGRFLPRRSHVVSVQYFTALATWDQEKVRRHQVYTRALKQAGVEVMIGRFKKLKKKIVVKNEASRRTFRTVDGPLQGSIFYGYTFEEKRTDVSIGCQMIAKAANDEYDIALLFSGDTDFEPAIDAVQNTFGKQIIVAVPNKRISGSIKKIVPAGNCVSIREQDVAASQLPDPILLDNGTQLTCPQSWK